MLCTQKTTKVDFKSFLGCFEVKSRILTLVSVTQLSGPENIDKTGCLFKYDIKTEERLPLSIVDPLLLSFIGDSSIRSVTKKGRLVFVNCLRK